MAGGQIAARHRRRLLLGLGASLFQISCLRPKFRPVHPAPARPAMEISMSVVSRLRSFAIATLLGLSVASCGYNTIPTLDENAKAKWAEVQAQYQRRADLIPNLVATVQGYAKQEKDVLTQVAEARAKATQIKVDASSLTDPDKIKQFQDAQAQLSGALGRLLAVSEAYPDLKSNANFLALQSQLEGTENRINVARRDYIEAARDFNLALRTFPTVLWAKTFFSSEKPLAEFTASDAAQGAPQVKF
jgi:LemA protein